MPRQVRRMGRRGEIARAESGGVPTHAMYAHSTSVSIHAPPFSAAPLRALTNPALDSIGSYDHSPLFAADGHLDPQERLPFKPQPHLGQYMTDGCLNIVMDDAFESANAFRMQPSDVIAPWHLRSPGKGMPCHYLFVRTETPIAGKGAAGQVPPSEEGKGAGQKAKEPFIKFDNAAQAALLRRITTAPPVQTQSMIKSVEEVIEMAKGVALGPTTGAVLQGDAKSDPFSKHAIVS